MNGLVRQIVVLSALWALLELLLPDGRRQPMIRMTMGILVMTAFLTRAGAFLSGGTEMPAWSYQLLESGAQSYRQTALKSLANQVENYCERQAERAGFEAEAGVWLRQDGSVEAIELRLGSEQSALMSAEELREHLARQLQTEAGSILLEGP